MLTKTCTGPCGRELDVTEFHWRNKTKGMRIARCRECASIWSKNHYRKNTEMYVKKAAKWNSCQADLLVKKVLDYLLTHPCVDCGETDRVVLQFDHVRGNKIADLGYIISVGRWGWEKAQEEIDKCQVRCANCHTRKTAKQFRWRKYLLTNTPL